MSNLDNSKMFEPKTNSKNNHIGYLDVFIQEARDIQNICIYHKQDVYAKIYLTTDPESSISTHTINGGGRNPIFNQKLRLDVSNIDSSLKCEVWMLSRVKNYLEDQLLGFTLIPLSDVLLSNNKLAQEFSLSTNDIFHSPSGFIQLSISYTGSSPEVLAITPRTKNEETLQENNACELDKIEFPDLNIVTENQMMISEYFDMQCTDLGVENDNEAGIRVVDCLANANSPESVVACEHVESVDSHDSSEVDKKNRKETLEKDVLPVININIEMEQPVKQQDFVDMYNKSMNEFTASLANMKLPMDIENSNSSCTSSNSGENGSSTPDSKKVLELKKSNAGARVFYGSRAFF